jgi:hypothetical protein
MTAPAGTSDGPRGQLAAGITLVVVGVLGWAVQHLGAPGRSLLLALGGGALLAAYFYTRRYGFLVPAGILLGLGFGRVAGGYGAPSHLAGSTGLGLGFLAIYVIDRLYRGRSHWWPLVPGVILMLGGVRLFYGGVARLLRDWSPLLVVALGIVLIVRSMRRRSTWPRT